jgi:hypothetical protein
MHVVAEPKEVLYVPAWQFVHTANPAPVLYVPAEQKEHVACASKL